MKRLFSFPGVAFAILVALQGCSPSIQSYQTPASALVRIECASGSVQQIQQFLRFSRGKDISVALDGSYITAAFSPEDIPPAKLAQILQNLNELSGVLRVEVMENPRPIMQNF